jgi:hypothetical protein
VRGRPSNESMAYLILYRATREVGVSAAPHLSVEDVASMIDGTLPADERERAERHLADCDACREELATCARVVTSGTALPVRRFPWRNLVALAAGILLVVWIGRPAERERVTDVRDRAAPTAGSRIAVDLSPTGVAVLSTPPRFVWHPIEGSVGYHVVVKDASGAPVWSGDVADTALQLPDSVHLRANESYVWRVDGQRADGSSATSTESGFRIPP